MFRFANTEYLYLLFLVPVLLLIFRLGRGLTRRRLKQFGDPDILRDLMPDLSYSRPIVKFLLYVTALVFLILAVARPQFGTKLQEVKRKGIEIVIALDVSNSMLAQDIQPNRLEKAKQSISKLVERLVNDRIGLIVFAGQAYTQIPITNDYASAKMFLSSISTGIVPVQGTAIGSAIQLAIKSFTQQEDMSRVLIIITDGENHEDDAIAIAGEAASNGIKIYTIGVGLDKGSPLPLSSGSGQQDFLKDKDGNVVISKLNEQMLQQIAAEGGGKYIRANNTRLGLNALFEDINQLEKKEIEAKVYSEYQDMFQYPAALALLLIIIEYLILDRKNRRLKHIRLFKVENK
ncbi:MAG: VWA domain-containing protein [Bacteroidales bacterium]|nr:VWA domain-containing protein [Bacteroidales bacterium]